MTGAWHDQFGVRASDDFFVVAGNPNGDGGGVVASTNSWFRATDIKNEAIRQGYRDVQVLDKHHFWCMRSEERKEAQ